MEHSEVVQRSVYSPSQIEEWLKGKIASLTSLDPTSIDPTQPMAVLGLDSVMAICLVGELELLLDASVPEQLVSPQASIHELVRQLVVAHHDKRG